MKSYEILASLEERGVPIKVIALLVDVPAPVLYSIRRSNVPTSASHSELQKLLSYLEEDTLENCIKSILGRKTSDAMWALWACGIYLGTNELAQAIATKTNRTLHGVEAACGAPSNVLGASFSRKHHGLVAKYPELIHINIRRTPHDDDNLPDA